MTKTVAREDVRTVLDAYAGSKVPGLQYMMVDADGTRCEYAGGWADLRNRIPMAPDVTMMAYSMTKTITAVAVLQLVERGALELEDELDAHLPATPYRGRGITIRHLLAHTSGCPNPIPLRWAHLTSEAATFDEDAALARVLHDAPRLASPPGKTFRYSNIGYWLLGKIVESATGQAYADRVRDHVLEPLGITAGDLGFVIEEPARHARGYLARHSLLNLAKGFVMDSRFWGGYDGSWLRFESHHLNGPAFGGLVGTARGFSRFLRDQLRPRSILFEPQTKRLLEGEQTTDAGRPIPMTLGWHLGRAGGTTFLYKEGGGGGFHGEMRLYPSLGLASIVMVNDTTFRSTAFLDHLDAAFIP